MVAAFSQYGLSPEFIRNALLEMLLLILIFTDLRERRIPHAVTLFGIGVGLPLSLLVPVDSRPLEWVVRRSGFFLHGPISSLLGAITGAFLGGGFLYLVGEAFYYFGGRQKRYLGFGDVMLILMVGAFLGVPLTLLTILMGSLTATIVAGPLEIFNVHFRHYQWPYGSFLGAAAIFASLGGRSLIDAYLHWSRLA
jgi:prepilin signal peptidase PulO-like enzyme (type II secretory pathway)